MGCVAYKDFNPGIMTVHFMPRSADDTVSKSDIAKQMTDMCNINKQRHLTMDGSGPQGADFMALSALAKTSRMSMVLQASQSNSAMNDTNDMQYDAMLAQMAQAAANVDVIAPQIRENIVAMETVMPTEQANQNPTVNSPDMASSPMQAMTQSVMAAMDGVANQDIAPTMDVPSADSTISTADNTVASVETDIAPQATIESAEVSTPTIETQQTIDTPTTEAPRVETAQVESVKAEAPKVEAAKAETVQLETPKGDVPKADVSNIEAPKADAMKVETIVADTIVDVAPSRGIDQPQQQTVSVEVPAQPVMMQSAAVNSIPTMDAPVAMPTMSAPQPTPIATPVSQPQAQQNEVEQVKKDYNDNNIVQFPPVQKQFTEVSNDAPAPKSPPNDVTPSNPTPSANDKIIPDVKVEVKPQSPTGGAVGPDVKVDVAPPKPAEPTQAAPKVEAKIQTGGRVDVKNDNISNDRRTSQGVEVKQEIPTQNKFEQPKREEVKQDTTPKFDDGKDLSFFMREAAEKAKKTGGPVCPFMVGGTCGSGCSCKDKFGGAASGESSSGGQSYTSEYKPSSNDPKPRVA